MLSQKIFHFLRSHSFSQAEYSAYHWHGFQSGQPYFRRGVILHSYAQSRSSQRLCRLAQRNQQGVRRLLQIQTLIWIRCEDAQPRRRPGRLRLIFHERRFPGSIHLERSRNNSLLPGHYQICETCAARELQQNHLVRMRPGADGPRHMHGRNRH